MKLKNIILLVTAIIFVQLYLVGMANRVYALQKSFAISGVMPDFGDVDGWVMSPDNQYVVYHADQRMNGVYELFTVPVSGNASPVRISHNLPVGASVFDPVITPDSKTVLYLVLHPHPDDPGQTWIRELYSVPLTGGTAVQLHDCLIPSRSLNPVKLSADSRTALFAVTSIDISWLFTIPVHGGVRKKLIDAPWIADYKFSPDNRTVVFESGVLVPQDLKLFAVPITGGALTQLAPNYPEFFIRLFEFTPDGKTVIFGESGDGKNLYKVPTTGGAVTKLNGPLVPGGGIDSWVLTPDGSKIVYTADQDTLRKSELFAVTINDGSVTKLNADFPLDYNVPVQGYEISADSGKVVYLIQQENVLTEPWINSNESKLYKVSIDGEGATRLDKINNENLNAFTFRITPDGNTVIYGAGHDLENEKEIHSVSINGGAVKKLNHTMGADGRLWFLEFHPVSGRILYQTQEDTEEVYDLYSVPENGGTAIKLNDKPAKSKEQYPKFMGQNYGRFFYGNADGKVVYIADLDKEGRYELYSSFSGAEQSGVFSFLNAILSAKRK